MSKEDDVPSVEMMDVTTEKEGDDAWGEAAARVEEEETLEEAWKALRKLRARVGEMSEGIERRIRVGGADETMEKPEEEEEEAEVAQLVDKVQELAYSSYYYRVIEMLVAGDGTALPSATCVGWIPNAAITCSLISLQIFAMQSVWQLNWLEVRWSNVDDDAEIEKAFGGDMDRPHDWRYFINLFGENNGYSVEGVPTMTMILLFFVVVLLALQVRPEIEKCKMELIAFLEPEPISTEERKKALKLERPAPKDKTARLAVAYVLRVFKLCMLMSFYELTILILGTADGPFELLMKSLALLFILDIDDYINIDLLNAGLVFVLRKDNSHRKLTLPERKERSTDWIKKLVANAQRASADRGHHSIVALLHRNAVHVRSIVNITFVFVCAFAGQRYTARGRFVAYDDEVERSDRRQNLRAMFTLTRYIVLAMLLVEVHLASLVVRRSTTSPSDSGYHHHQVRGPTTSDIPETYSLYRVLCESTAKKNGFVGVLAGGQKLPVLDPMLLVLFFIDYIVVIFVYVLLIRWVLAGILPYNENAFTSNYKLWHQFDLDSRD